MNIRASLTAMLILSVLYGAAIAILSFLDVGGFTAFAVIGAIVLGVLWIVRSFLIRSGRIS